jgi:hypothetical protein
MGIGLETTLRDFAGRPQYVMDQRPPLPELLG